MECPKCNMRMRITKFKNSNTFTFFCEKCCAVWFKTVEIKSNVVSAKQFGIRCVVE